MLQYHLHKSLPIATVLNQINLFFPSHSSCLRFVLILSFQLLVGLPSDLFALHFLTKIFLSISFDPHVSCPADLIHWLPDECSLRSTNGEAPHFGVSSILLLFCAP